MTVPASFDRRALLDAAFQSTPDLVALLMRDGRVLDANRAALEFAHVTLAEAQRTPLWDAPGWSAHSALTSWLRSAVAHAVTGFTATCTETVGTPAGTARVLRFVLRLLPGQDQPSNALLLSAFDVHAPDASATDAFAADAFAADAFAADAAPRDAESQRLIERERRVRMLTDNMHDLLFLVRVEAAGRYRVESVNRAYLSVTGLEEPQVVGRLVQEVLRAADAEIAIAHCDLALASAEPITYRETISVPAGRLIVETTMSAVRDAHGRATHLLGLSRDVSGEERTLAALRASEARFRATLDAGFDAFVIAEAVRDAAGTIEDFRIVDANIKAARTVGESVAGLRGVSLLDAFPHSAGTGLWEQCCHVVETQTPVDMAHSAPVPGLPGRRVQRQVLPLGESVAISSRDVTAREHEREALLASEARHRALFESSSAIQLIVDEETGALLDANPAAEAFYGWSAESMRSMLISDLADTTLEAWRAEWPRKTRERVSTVLHRHRVAEGQPRDVEIAASRIQFDGHSARHLIVHDVSDRTRAEAELRESEARFRAVINGMSEGVVIHDASGAIRAFNPGAERILGLTGAQLRGLQPIDRDWQAVREDGTEWPASQHPAMQALRSGRTQERALMGIRRGAEEDVWLQVTAHPLIRPGESIPYASVAVFSDVTARRSAEERLRQAQKLEAVGQLAGGIAHDFNNLLTVIRGASGFLRDAVPQHSPLLDDIQSIERATVRAEELTRRLLAVGRRQMLRTETVDLRALVQEQFPAIREATSRTIRLQAQLGETSVPARLDRRQVLDALRALVDNARAAMPTGGTLTLSTGIRRLERPDDGVPDAESREFAMLEVRDTGAGMSDEVRARLFEPFFSTQPFGLSHGMGLASVHGMVAQSHGYIECDSAPGEGTSLRLYFPCAATPEAVATPPAGATAVASRGILLVDDDPMLRELARRMLERLGHSVAAVASGHDALDVLSVNGANVAVLVTDLTMPGMSGMELIDATQRLYPHLPIVAISGFSMHASAREDLASRRVVYLGKPFQAGELAAALERAVGAAVTE